MRTYHPAGLLLPAIFQSIMHNRALFPIHLKRIIALFQHTMILQQPSLLPLELVSHVSFVRWGYQGSYGEERDAWSGRLKEMTTTQGSRILIKYSSIFYSIIINKIGIFFPQYRVLARYSFFYSLLLSFDFCMNGESLNEVNNAGYIENFNINIINY